MLAVLTGDLIGSTRAAPSRTETTLAALAEVAALCAHWPTAQDTAFARHRGDGWQLVLPARYAFRASAHVLLLARRDPVALPTRLAVGLGEGTLSPQGLAAARGPAFVASGQALDQMARSAPEVALVGAAVTPFLAATLPLVAERISRWTPPQAEAARRALTLPAPTHQAMADELGISKQAVSLRLAAAGLAPLRSLIEAWEVP